MKPLSALVLACALLVPAVPLAQPVFGAQVGAAVPLGSRADGAALGDEVRAAFPLELRAGWRISPAITLGLQGGWGYALAAEARDASCGAQAVDCSSHAWRAAVRGEYGFPGERWRPFVAGTLGWEQLVQRWESTADNWELTRWNGWAFGLEGGADRPLGAGGHLAGGLFAAAGLGQYLGVSERGETAGYGHADARGVPGAALHYWLGVGVRGTFELQAEARRPEAPTGAGAPPGP